MTSKYVVVHAGDLHREEHMNVGVLAWEVAEDLPKSVVHLRLLQNWTRLVAAFPSIANIRDDIEKRLQAIKTYGDYVAVIDRMGPYTPFEFTEERPSLLAPDVLIVEVAPHFLVES